jgi:multisubunit Na+/H+ antiporter MnhG subunit
MQAVLRQIWLRGSGWIVWLLIFLVICGDVARRPFKHTTTPTYRLASTQWWAGQDPYTYHNHDGFLYFPQAAILFTPFTWGPLLLGEIVWRLLCFGLFGYALIRLQDFFLRSRAPALGKTFLILSLLAVPSAMASLRNAQFDLPLAALFILGAAEIASERWSRAATWLCLALALKPLAVVPLLLFGALYGKLIPRLLVGAAIVVLVPFLNPNPAFVAHEYVRCAQTLVWATGADEPRYSDLGALLGHAGFHPTMEMKTIARLFFAPVFLGAGWIAVRRLARADAAWSIGALSAAYLMLFNPRTETCSYVFLGPFVASLAIAYARSLDRRRLAVPLGIASLGLASDAIPYIHGLTDQWLKPLLALLFLPVLADFILRSQRNAVPAQPSPEGMPAGTA